MPAACVVLSGLVQLFAIILPGDVFRRNFLHGLAMLISLISDIFGSFLDVIVSRHEWRVLMFITGERQRAMTA